jgi:hypothetical protein
MTELWLVMWQSSGLMRQSRDATRCLCVYLMNLFLSMPTGSKIQKLVKYLKNLTDFFVFASISYILPY